MNWFTALSFKNTCYTCYGVGSWYEEPELETELETELKTELNNEKL